MAVTGTFEAPVATTWIGLPVVAPLPGAETVIPANIGTDASRIVPNMSLNFKMTTPAIDGFRGDTRQGKRRAGLSKTTSQESSWVAVFETSVCCPKVASEVS